MVGEVILVAVDASKEISSDHALEWAVQNVIKPEEKLILLAVFPSFEHPKPTLHQRVQTLACSFFRCGTRHIEGRNVSDQVHQSKRDILCKINYTYAHKMQQLCLANNLIQVHYQVKVILDARLGSVSAKARETKASWVILDRFLNKEAVHCIKQLNCNVVLIDHSIPRILKTVNEMAGETFGESRSQIKPTEKETVHVIPSLLDNENVTSPSTSDIRSSTFGTYSFSVSSPDKECQRKTNLCNINDSRSFIHLNSGYFSEDFEYMETFNLSPSDIKYKHKISSSSTDENHKSGTNPFNGEAEDCSDNLRAIIYERKHHFGRTNNIARRLIDSSHRSQEQDSSIQPEKPVNRRDSMTYSHKHEPLSSSSTAGDMDNRNSIVAQVTSLSITNPLSRYALCSICMHKTHIFRNVPRRFTFREIETATDGFSDCNLMAEGGYSCVYRGHLPDGQVIAVKQFKKLKAFAASEFSLQVETLGCAQHRNLLMIVGHCIDTQWLLIYKLACNGSLDKHLYRTETNQVMAWHDRMKVAVGTARGLRYLHEDCRAGCIFHEDLRPSNILLTHDFEPMIGDFGLARLQLNAQLAKDTHLQGRFGYLAPEYIQTGQVSEKGDVYAFGVILLELLSGFRAIEFSGKTSKQTLSEWGNTMLEKKKPNELIDYRLNNDYVEKEAESIMHAAYLCILPHPEQRPKMSQVLKILEGDLPIDCASMHQSSRMSKNESVGTIKATKYQGKSNKKSLD